MLNLFSFQKQAIEIGSQNLSENIKLLLYKVAPNIFDIIDFENDIIYKESLLFAFFNTKDQTIDDLNSILLGYSDKNFQVNEIKVHSDSFGKVYLPKLGWLLTNQVNTLFYLNWKNGVLDLKNNNKKVEYILEPIEYIHGTSIELLKYPIMLFDQCYFDVDHRLIDVEIEEITKRHKVHLTRAFNLIKEFVPEHYHLIELATSKVVIFNVDTYLRNSFATMKAQGTVFFNACQENYNEVFFVDDIAHQTGHTIFNALIYEVENFLKVSRNLTLESISLPTGITENRDIHVIFHALYTYYTTFICLDACLNANAFTGHKKHEALGRMAFYIGKCYKDLGLIEKPVNKMHTSENLFTANGLIIYDQIRSVFKNMVNKWGPIVHSFEMNNQPYNFNYSIFLTSNPINENF